MKDRRLILGLRISLILAVVCAGGTVALTELGLRPQMRKLSREREEFRTMSDQRLAYALKAEARARELAEQLANKERQIEAARLETKRLNDACTRSLLDLEESRAELHGTKQKLARWNATGTTPDHVAFLVAENKQLGVKTSALEKQIDRVRQDYANLKRILDVPIDEDAVPELPPMKGSVLVVDPKWNFVVLDLGEKEGLRNRGVLMVSREGRLIGKVQVRRVDGERGIADILPGWSIGEVREGDQVIN